MAMTTVCGAAWGLAATWATRPWSLVVGLLVVAVLLAIMGVWLARRR